MTRMWLALFLSVAAGWAEGLELAPQFSHNMVLQRGTENRIWGKRQPNPKVEVTVEFRMPGYSTRRESTKGEGDRWHVDLSIGEPKGVGVLTIWEGKANAKVNEITINNVIVGDVWVVAVPPGMGFSSKPEGKDGIRVLSLSAPSLLQSLGQPNKMMWSEVPRVDRFETFAFEVAAQLRKLDPKTPIGVIATTTDGLASSLKFAPYEETEKLDNFVTRAGPVAKDDMKNARRADEERLIDLKHKGLVGEPVKITDYGKFKPYRRESFTEFGEIRDWSFKGVVCPPEFARP